MEKQEEKNKKTLKGVVVSDKMDKTIVVSVDRYIKHPKYGKYYTISKRIKAHDENNECKVGDKVLIEETKKISKGKAFIVSARPVIHSKANKDE